MSAEAIGWDFQSFVVNMLNQARPAFEVLRPPEASMT